MAFRRISPHGEVRANRLPTLRYLAEMHDVPLERLVETIKARKIFVRARRERARSRRRWLEKEPNARSRRFRGRVYAGEGEFHDLLRESGMTVEQFSALAGIGRRTVSSWKGHPLFLWPIQLLYFFIWSKNMAAAFKERRVDPNIFRPKGLPRAPQGRYPRTRKDLEELLGGP